MRLSKAERQERESYRRKLAKLRRKLRPDLDRVLANPDGLARLLAISDEEWQAAVEAEEDNVAA